MTGKPRERYHVTYLRCWQCGQHHFNTCLIQIIPVDAPPSPWYAQGSENGMEALELDTPTETVSAPESLTPSENLAADLQA